MAGEQISVSVQAAEPTPEETAAALAAAAETAPTNEAEARAQIEAEGKAAERPEGLPAEFESWEAMAKHYAGQGKEAEGEPEGDPEAEEDDGEEDLDDVNPEDQELGDVEEFSLETYDTEYAEKGELSDESYEALAAKGFNRATVDGYIAGQEALAELATTRITEAAGGAENMQAMFAWASTSLTPEEVGKFNDSFQHADVNAGVIAMEQLKAKYQAANGVEGELLGGKPNGNRTDQFTSWAEVTQAMSDPRYQSDHAYRSRIEAKMSRSNNIR